MNAVKTLCCVVLALGVLESRDAAAAWQLVWSDEFDGPAIDTSVWGYEIGYIRNNELQYYTRRPENARIENGNLVIEARKESYNGYAYTSASLNTRGTQSWKYGRIEMRARLVKGKGMWPAFWAMGNNGSWPGCGELDIMELIGGGPGYDDKIYGTIHWDDNGHKSVGGSTRLASGAFADSFHVIGVVWDSATIHWQLDGNEYFPASIADTARQEFHQRFWLLVNLAVGGSWPGSPDTATVFPQQYQIDWIRVYQPEGTTQNTGGNMIENPEFDLGTTFWSAQFSGGATGSMNVVSGAGLSGANALHVALTAAGTATWHGQIAQNTPVQVNDTLDISFMARAAAAKNIDILIQQGGSPYTEYFRQAVSVGTTAQTYGPYRYISRVNDLGAQFKFLVANNTTELWLDKVEVLLRPATASGVRDKKSAPSGPDRVWQKQGRLFIQGRDNGPQALVVADLAGTALYQGRYRGPASIDVRGLAAGIYVVRSGDLGLQKILITR